MKKSLDKMHYDLDENGVHSRADGRKAVTLSEGEANELIVLTEKIKNLPLREQQFGMEEFPILTRAL